MADKDEKHEEKLDGRDRLLNAIKQNVKNLKQSLLYGWIDKNGEDSTQLTYEDVWRQAGMVADNILNIHGIEPGSCVVLCYDFGMDFIQVNTFVIQCTCSRGSIFKHI